MKSASDTALEMIVRVDHEERYGWFAAVQDGENLRSIECRVDCEAATEKQARADAANWIAGVIEQARYDGAVEALREVTRRVDEYAAESSSASDEHNELGDAQGRDLERGRALAYERVACLVRELASRSRSR